MKLFFKSIMLFGLILNLACACMIREEHRGKALSDDTLSQLKVNKSTKEQVMDLLGTPSGSSCFDSNTWHYMSLKKHGMSVLRPSITDQKVVQLKFKNDILTDIKIYKGDEARSRSFSKEKTQVEGHDQTVLKEFSRNLGRYNK